MARSQGSALILLALGLAGCSAPVTPPPATGEQDNPRDFRVLALRDGAERYEETDAGLSCMQRVYCDTPSADCYCERYKLRTTEFSIEWSREATVGAHLRTADRNLIARDRYGGEAVAELTVTSRFVIGSPQVFFTGYAGTLRVETKEHTYTSGIFYAPITP